MTTVTIPTILQQALLQNKDQMRINGVDRQQIVLIVLAIGLITAGHYLFAPRFGVAHNLLQRLYYIPVIWSAYRYGLKGGLYASVLSSLLYLPHVLISWNKMPEYQINQILEIILFIVIGTAAGRLFDQKTNQQHLLQKYEKMASFGNLSRSIIRSLRVPLKAIKGMLITLEHHSGSYPAITPCTDVISSQISVIENVRNDLISLVERKKMRLKKRNLNEILFEFMSAINTELKLSNISLTKRVSNINIHAYTNKKAIHEALHHLTEILIGSNQASQHLVLYVSESQSLSWIGATVKDPLLNTDNLNGSSDSRADNLMDYRLLPVVNTMNNHFGEARFRWAQDQLIEFRLEFPKKLKLPWHLRDEPIKSRL